MIMVRLALAVLMSLMLVGCTAHYKSERAGGGAAPQLVRGQPVIYVAVPEDGWYVGNLAPGSGAMTAQAVMNAFLPHAARVERGTLRETHDAALASAATGKYTHLIEPTILSWEERATEWSGKPDRVSIRLNLFEVPSGRQIDSVIVNGSSKWATLGGDHPQDLLPDPLRKYADEVFQVPK